MDLSAGRCGRLKSVGPNPFCFSKGERGTFRQGQQGAGVGGHAFPKSTKRALGSPCPLAPSVGLKV